MTLNYYKFFIQKESKDAKVIDTVKEFGMYEMSSVFYGGGTVKNVPSRSWYDENGDDEFVPQKQKYKAYDMNVKFGFHNDFNTANSVIDKFMDFLNDGTMKIYDSYNQVGRQNVRFMGIPDDAELIRHPQKGDLLIINVKFKVNDPVTEVIRELDSDGNVTALKVKE